MILDKDVADHLVSYIKQNPTCIRMDDFRDETRVVINGNLDVKGNSWNNSRHDFSVSIFYDKKGKIIDINGVVSDFDTTNLVEAIKQAIKQNFKVKSKITKLKGEE